MMYMYLWEIWLAVGPLPVQVLISSHRRSGCTICTCKYWRKKLTISCSFSLCNQNVKSLISAFMYMCTCVHVHNVHIHMYRYINMLKIISVLTEIFSKNDPISIHKAILRASVLLISQHINCKNCSISWLMISLTCFHPPE